MPTHCDCASLQKKIEELESKLREVPWTEEELKDQIQFLTGYVRASNGILNSGKVWEYGVEGGAKYLALWAEKRIKDRV